MSVANIQYLEIAGEQVGSLEWGPEADFPWAKGKWIAFDKFKHCEKFLTLLSSGHYDLDFYKLLDAGVSSTQLRLISSVDEKDVEYLHGLVLGNDDYAAWRFGEEPLGDD